MRREADSEIEFKIYQKEKIDDRQKYTPNRRTESGACIVHAAHGGARER